MNTYTSILEITPEIAVTMKKSQVRRVAEVEIAAIDERFKAEGKSLGMGGTAKNALATSAKDVAAGCLNLILPFAALGHFKQGKKKTAITQVVLCGLSIIIPAFKGVEGVVMGVILCYIVAFIYNFVLGIWERLVELKNSTKAMVNLLNPYIQWKNITCVEHFSTPAYYEEYIALLDVREAHYKQIIKLCK